MSLIATALYYLAFAKGTVLLSSVAGMLSGAIPLFTFLVAWVFLRAEPLNVRSACGTLLGFLGILLIARPWTASEAGAGDLSLVGVLWMLAGSLSLGVSFVYARRFVSLLGLSPVALATYQMGIAALILACVTDLDGIGAVFEDARAALGLIVGLGLAGTGLAYVLYYLLVQRMGAVRASAVTYLPPVVALLIGVAAGEPVRGLDLVAMAAILAGVWIVQGARAAGAPAPRRSG
jgi:drug/metabolite transporter (DMT)-like permease